MWRLAVIVALAPLAGCASSEALPRRQQGIIVGSQGAGSEVVFHGVQVSGADEAAGEELTRRDSSLNVRCPATAFDVDAWPAAPVLALDDAQYLHLPRNPNTYIYFNTVYPRGGWGFDRTYLRSWE
jgi:hypothetical protein